MQIRAKDKLTNGYIYIYSIYVSSNRFDGSCWHFLCSSADKYGLNVFILDEIKDFEILDFEWKSYNSTIDDAIMDRINKNDWIINKDLNVDLYSYYIHPILNYFLKNEWEVYEGIIEGQAVDWLKFEEKLGFRP